MAAPVTLADALAQGAEQSPRIAQAAAQAQAAQARARQAGVSPNPEIGLEIENFAGTGPFREVRGAEATLEVTQRFELGSKRSARVAVAAAERDFALLSFKRARAALARSNENTAWHSFASCDGKRCIACRLTGAELDQDRGSPR